MADYWEEENKRDKKNLTVKGKIHVIRSLGDFNRLKRIQQHKLTSGKTILKVDQEIIASRNYDVLGALASWKTNLFILYPGVAATQHAMRVLTDKGHKAFLIGNQKFDQGDDAQIHVKGDKVRITNLSHTQKQECVSLWDASLLGRELCGGKAYRLSELKLIGFQVPHGIVCTTILFDNIMDQMGFSGNRTIEQYPTMYHKLRQSIDQIAGIIREHIRDYIDSGKAYSVRSSATIEDDSSDSMAGMFDTYLNVSGEDLAVKAAQVFATTYSPRIAAHIRSNPSLIQQLKMAVVVQEMVASKYAGVIFGAQIQTGNMDIVWIEANQGLGEGVVSGESREIEQYTFSRNERKVRDRKGPKLLASEEARALFMLSERLRSEFGDKPQDIEWAIDQQNHIWVLQSRDLYLHR